MNTMKTRFPSISLAVFVICASPALCEIGLVPSLVPDESTTRVVRLEPFAVPGFDALGDDMQSLSDGTKVFLKKELDGELGIGLLILVSPGGTRRLIMTKGTVTRMRCAGDKIYTQELLESYSGKQRRMDLQKEAEAVGLAHPEVKFERPCVIRQYDPAAEASRTLAVRDFPYFHEFLAAQDCLYFFELSKATRRGFRITRLPLSGDSGETSTVILGADAGARPFTGWFHVYSFQLRNGWVYYRAALTEKTLPKGDASSSEPYVLANAICRVNLATGERQKIVDRERVFAFCVTEAPETLVYLAGIRDGGDRRYLGSELGVVPLDPFSPAATYRLGAVESRLWYDEAAKTVMLCCEHFLVEFDPARHRLELYREEAPSMRDLYRVVIED